MKKVIQQGESIRLYVDYADVNTGEPTDPLSLTATIREPDMVNNVIVYPNVNFVQEATGSYFVRFFATKLGTHHYEITAQVGANDFDVRNGLFDVEASI